MSSVDADNPGTRYWRSLDDLAGTPDARARLSEEFPGGTETPVDGASRREFLKLMGASLALGGMAGCRWPKETIVPYAYRPPGRTPGQPERYATAMEIGGVATGLLVTSYDGRPIKVEGNPSHPFSLGATSAIHQASVLELYDPDRSRTVVRREGGQTIRQSWDDFAGFAQSHFAELRQRKGKGLAILSEATSSPSVARLRARLAEVMPDARWYEYEPISWDNEREGTRLAFGKPLRPQYHFDQADVIVCLDADPLLTHPAAVRYARDFAKGRRGDDGRMNRLYVIESAHSITGSMADHRLAVSSREVGRLASVLCSELLHLHVKLPRTGEEAVFGLAEPARRFILSLAQELEKREGACLVLAGARQPARTHALAQLMTVMLGELGKTVTYTVDPEPARPAQAEAIKALGTAMAEGEIETLVILGANPVCNAPSDAAVADNLAKVKTSIHLSLYDDETSSVCTWHVPRAHYLESWDDARAYDGTISIVQPLIAPLYGGKTPSELIAMVLGKPSPKGHDIVRRTFQQIVKQTDMESAWRGALHEGIIAGTAWPEDKAPAAHKADFEKLLSKPSAEAPTPGYELVFCQDHSVYDGRFANNAWLQEWPDPMTKLTWDNAALVSSATAKRIGLANGDLLRLKVGDRQAELPAFILPGQADGTIAVSLGYGRRKSGRVGDGVGVDAYQIRTSITMGFATGVQVERVTEAGAPKKHAFATTQDQHPITPIGQKEKHKRISKLILEADLREYKAHPDFAKHAVHHPPLESLWTEHAYGPHRWAMAIDLSACIGCGACVVACQAENNVPVVGKAQVARGREMHWIRVDRYFKGDPDTPTVVHQPVMCAHCENAPCEQVCPVAATVHDAEGLNVMVYNRCVGTRYCSNNCPFKVRRFNYFNYRTDLSDTEKMAMNPEVTVRSRGVMEKCTYCVQRIQAAKIQAKNERKPIRDGQIVPACAQVCPTGAIVFGDLADTNSEVWRLQNANQRAYHMLAELNIKPRTAYLAKLRNRNPELARPDQEGHS